MLNSLKLVNESEMAQKLSISVVEDDKFGIYTIADAVSIRGLFKIFNMTSNYNNDGKINKRNLEKKDFIFCILKDAERELREISDEEVDITSSIKEEAMEVRSILINGDDTMTNEYESNKMENDKIENEKMESDKMGIIKELKEQGLNNAQILTIVRICRIKNFEYDYGSIVFEIEDEMTVGFIKEINEKTIELLKNVGLTASTYDSSFRRLVFDIDQFHF